LNRCVVGKWFVLVLAFGIHGGDGFQGEFLDADCVDDVVFLRRARKDVFGYRVGIGGWTEWIRADGHTFNI
jgi:hypothetical protein